MRLRLPRVATVDRSYIRTKALVALTDPAVSRLVVARFADPTKTPDRFHRLPGGNIELGERSSEAAVREIREELGIELVQPRLLGVLENIFDYRGEAGHEIVFVYAAVVDPGLIPDEGCDWFCDNDEPMWVEWRSLTERHRWPLYPAGVEGLLTSV